MTKDEEGRAATALTESDTGFPTTLLFAYYHCSLNLSETCYLFQHIMYEF